MMRTDRGTAGLRRQMSAFAGVGVVAAVAHYGVLIGLVETGGFDPVPATLLGYVAGGIVSYVLNRRVTYASNRPHAEAGWRFAAVAAGGFLLTWVFMHGFTRWLGAPYLPAQIVTTGIVLVWSFVAHKLWTFAASPLADAPSGRSALPPSPGRRSRGDSNSPIKGEEDSAAP
jgi:putative flippase GtrA